jgi:hypothetical protein
MIERAIAAADWAPAPQGVNHMRLQSLALLLILSCTSSVAESRPASCDTTVLPHGISDLLNSRFEGWRIRTVEDMEPYDRQLWTKSEADPCPGITSGRFLSSTKQTFAVLLVPAKPDHKGYKIIAFDEADGRGVFTPIIVLEDTTQSAVDLAIFRLPPGLYTDPDRSHRVRIQLDGLQVERMEVSTTLYFWRAGRFEHLVTSD